MAKNLPAKVDDYTALQAQSTFNEAERKAFKDLSDYIRKHTKDTIWWYWELGQKVKKIYDEAKNAHGVYGQQFMPRLARALGFQSDSQLRSSMHVVAAFETKKAFGEFVKLQGEAGNVLSWSHIVYLSSIGDDETRMTLAAATLSQGWTAADLWQKVKELCSRKARGRRNPVIKIPASARSCITHVTSQAEKFVFNYDNAWTGDAFDLQNTVRQIPADKLNDKLLDSVRTARGQVSEMQRRATEMADILANTETDIAARMAAQAELRAQQEADLAAAAGTDATPEAPASVPRIAKPTRRHGPTRPGRVGTNR